MNLEAHGKDGIQLLKLILETHFGVFLELKKAPDLDEQEQIATELTLQVVAGILGRIDQYYAAHPTAIDKYFFTELDRLEAETFLQSLDVFTRVNKNNITEEQNEIIQNYMGAATGFLERTSSSNLTEAYVIDLFDTYKKELKIYCEKAIKQYVADANYEVYVFAIQSFPNHYYQLVTMNSVEALHSMSQGDGFKEAATYGFESELYNPACFDIEIGGHDRFDEVESHISDLFGEFYNLTNEYNDNSFKAGSQEYDHIIKLDELARELFVKVGIEVLQEVDFSTLNRSDNFCAVMASHEFSIEESYEYAKQTIPEDQFDKIFPNAYRVEEDYLDLDNAEPNEIIEYLISYINDFYHGTVPEGRYYTESKVYEYVSRLQEFGARIHDKAVMVLENIVKNAPAHPEHKDEKCFICMFSNEGKVFSHLVDAMAETDGFSKDIQSRLVEMFKTVTNGMKPSNKYPTFAHRDLAIVIHATDKAKYPEIKCDLETSYLSNIDDYLK